jgi:AraC family transcriptional regulator
MTTDLTTSSRSDRLAAILDLVVQAMAERGTTGADLAARAHLSRFYFDRLVVAATGEPPGALRRRLLLERSAHRLTSTRWTVLDVAVEAGYGSHEAYSRAFAREYGRAPTAVRREPPRTFRQLELTCPSGVHFLPPGGLRLPATRKETSMDVLEHLTEHHVDSLTAILERAGRLPDDVLDRPIVVSVETSDGEQTLRSLLNAMVTQEEHWLCALRGGSWPDESDASVPGLAARHAVAGGDYLTVVREALADGQLADTFVDTTCEPPTTHTLGGTIGHVITFAAVRRTLAAGALETYGIPDLGATDPRPFLNGLDR